MLVKNLTPFLCAARSTSLRPPNPSMSVVVRASFALADDGELRLLGPTDDRRPLSSERYRQEDDDASGSVIQPSDFADFKPRAEVLLTGSCHAPRGVSVTECAVQAKVGAWAKSLRVVGRRESGGKPASFASMPLDWEHAYGGVRYPTNPVGRGYDSDEMANVLTMSAGLEPASFGPINPRWPQRASRIGKDFGVEYVRTRRGFLPVDFDPAFFLEASPDQWLNGYLRGDEAVVLSNLHPRKERFETRLPSVKARAFCRDDAGAFREVPLHLDTLYFDLDALRMELTWRGLLDVREDELQDVTLLLVAAETFDGPTMPLGHYEEIAARFEADPTGFKAAVPADVSAASPTSSETIEPLAPLLDERLGPLQPSELKEAMPVLDQLISTAASRSPEVEKGLREKMAEARNEGAEPPPPRVTKPGAKPYVGLRRRIRDVLARAVHAREEAIAKGVERERLGELMEVEAIADDPQWVELDPSYTPPRPLSTDAPGPGANLVDRDLRGQDLRGIDLEGANLEGALLTGARLDGARLSRARLYGATLYEATLDDADLRSADLSRVNAGFVRAERARFDEALFDQAFFEDASLQGASFLRASGAYAVFTRAKLSRAILQGARFPSVEIDDADLDGANFEGGSFERGRFSASRCAKADFSGASLIGATFESADLSEARLFDANADRAIFKSAQARKAIFAFAKLRGCYMGGLSAPAADLHGADLKHSRIQRALLEGARVTCANLFGADLSKALLQGAKLTKSNLYQAKLTHAVLTDCDLAGANLKKSTLEQP